MCGGSPFFSPSVLCSEVLRAFFGGGLSPAFESALALRKSEDQMQKGGRTVAPFAMHVELLEK